MLMHILILQIVASLQCHLLLQSPVIRLCHQTTIQPRRLRQQEDVHRLNQLTAMITVPQILLKVHHLRWRRLEVNRSLDVLLHLVQQHLTLPPAQG